MEHLKFTFAGYKEGGGLNLEVFVPVWLRGTL
jgi:hypothetical protein